MPKDLEYYRELMNRYLRNECTPLEAEELLDYIGQSEANRLLLQSMQSTFHEALDETLDQPANHSQAEWAQRIRKNLLQHTTSVRRIPLHQRWIFRAAAAAILLLILAGGWYFYFSSSSVAPQVTTTTTTTTTPATMNDIPPGGNKAVLTLADGSTIVLDEAKDGDLTVQGNTKVIKLNDRLTYQSNTANNNEILYNTISTPRGGQYVLVLPDGTKVWLNAASSLKFPTAFSGKDRRVTLTGEGYFEVAKNASMPFHVNSGAMDVQVLGTHFNISAYEEERTLKTTLLEGSVKVTTATPTHDARSMSQVLSPGEQAVYAKASSQVHVIENADVDLAVAWKNGYFQFNRTPLETVMRQLQRWYDVEIHYEGSIPQKTFWGKIPMNINAAEALKILENSGIQFRIEGKKIIIKS